MNVHPVPQQIGAFQFKLFGSLTLRQFIFVGTGGLLAWIIIYGLRPPILAYPLGFLVFSTGMILGLVTLQGRSFVQWFFAFINAIFTPTLRIYQKKESLPEFLNFSDFVPAQPNVQPFAETEKKLRLEEYLENLPKKGKNVFDLTEEQRLATLNFGPSDSKGKFPLPKDLFQVSGLGEKEIVHLGQSNLASTLNYTESRPIAVVTPNDQFAYFAKIGRPRVRELGYFVSPEEKPLQPLHELNSKIEDLFEYTPPSKSQKKAQKSSFIPD